MKRVLSLLIAFVLVLAMVPTVSLAAEAQTVYLDPVNGADTNAGTEAAPLLTVAAAYAALEGATEGEIVLLGTLVLSETTYFPACEIPVTITSKTGAEGIKSSKSIFFGGDTTLDKLTLTVAADNNTTYLSSEGHDLTIGASVTTKSSYSGRRFCLTTKYGEGSMDGATLTVNSGNWRSIFVAGYTKATTGSCTLIMNGGNVNNIVGPTYSGTVTGNVTMIINGGTINVLDPGPNTTGTLNGNVDITVTGGTFTKLRPQSARPISGTVTLTIDGDCSGVKAFEHKTASVGKKMLVLKSGTLTLNPGSFDEVSLEIPQNKTLLLSGCAVTATTVNSAGILQFSGSSSLTAGEVIGTLNCDVTDTVLADHAYVTAPASSSVVFAGDDCIVGDNGVWKYSSDVEPTFDTVNFKGLVLTTTADDVTIEFYKYFSTKEEYLQTPVHVDGKTQYYAVIAGNRYRYVAKPTSGNNRYTIHKNLYFSAEEAAQKTVIDVTPGVRSTSGWDTPNEVCDFTDEYLEAVPSDASLWPQYADVFTSPAFGEGRNDHQQTTQTEMENYLAALDDPDDNIYVYTLGQTAVKSFNIPIVIVTSVDLSGVATWEEAAELIRADSEKNGKVTVHYQAQIHGNEPAAGEAALGMIKQLDGAYGKGLLDKLNIYVIPRLNPYGAYKSNRVTWLDSSTYTDPNRDFLHLQTAEVQARMRAFNAFEPEVVFDNHEYQFDLSSLSSTRTDMMYCCHPLPFASDDYNKTAIDMTYASFAQMEADGLTYSWYNSGSSGSMGGVGGNTGSSNTAARATFHILMETLGSNYGLNMYERRVASHASAVTGLLNYLHDNAATVKSVIKTERETMVENGKTYREDDVFVMQTASVDAPEYYIEGVKYSLITGEASAYTYTAKWSGTIKRTRIAPTAYVLPADIKNIDHILNLMDMQGIAYTYIPEGATLPLQQYIGTVEAADLAEEKTVTFRNGAYVFTMAQVDAQILGMLMEIDVNYTAEQKGSLAQQELIVPTDGVFPVYRYIHDLNKDDFVDYTIVVLPAKEITVYLDGTNGADTNDGLTEATAVQTLEQAYTLINTALADGGNGSNGTIVITGVYELGAAAYNFPACAFPVTVTGKTTSDGLSFTGGTGDAHIDRAIHLHGDTTFQNVKLHVNNSYTYSYIFANGHKLVMGENVNTTVNKSNYYFAISGGSVTYGTAVDTVDVTIRSGKWRMIYLGGYYANVTGLAKLDISNASVVYSIVSSYRGNVGSLEMRIANTTVSTTTDKTHGIFAGTYTSNSNYNCGKVLGDVTIVLGENVTATGVYGTARSYGRVYGSTKIIADGVDLTKAPVIARYAGLSSSYPTGYVELILNEDVAAAVTMDPAAVLNLNGHNVTGALTVDGTMKVKDSQTDDYTVADGVYGKITGTVTGTLAAAEGYVAVDGQSFHRFSQRISGISIRPSVTGMYYAATWLCDEVLSDRIDTFGVAVSLVDMPDETFNTTDTDTLWTATDGEEFVSGNKKTSVMISNILKKGEDNDTRGKQDIYAAPYAIFKDGTKLVCGTEVANSFYDVMHLADQKAYEANMDALESFYKTWEDPMSGWGFTNIGVEK